MDAIVAVDRNWAIGSNGGMLFSLPTDMRRFRSLTLGSTILMGRKTLDSFPDGKPLGKRRNIVLSTQEIHGQRCTQAHQHIGSEPRRTPLVLPLQPDQATEQHRQSQPQQN